MKERISVLLAAIFVLVVVFAGCTVEKSSVTLGNVLVLGDSYSTFEGHIPDGYATYYSKKSKKFGVDSHRKTWWYRLAKRTGSNILLNSSYSGSTICNTGYGGADCSAYPLRRVLTSL